MEATGRSTPEPRRLYFSRVAAEVLETMFFTQASSRWMRHGWKEEAVSVRVAFDGSHSGEMWLSVTRGAAPSIASAFLGGGRRDYRGAPVASDSANSPTWCAGNAQPCGRNRTSVGRSRVDRAGNAPADDVWHAVVLDESRSRFGPLAGVQERPEEPCARKVHEERKIKVLIVDDSAIVRKILTEVLAG